MHKSTLQCSYSIMSPQTQIEPPCTCQSILGPSLAPPRFRLHKPAGGMHIRPGGAITARWRHHHEAVSSRSQPPASDSQDLKPPNRLRRDTGLLPSSQPRAPAASAEASCGVSAACSGRLDPPHGCRSGETSDVSNGGHDRADSLVSASPDASDCARLAADRLAALAAAASR